jgi:sugar O-acyltransferase (sialic acid O-acetyltransferase NeuD family)
MTDHVLVGGGAFARELLDWFGPALLEQGHCVVGCLDDGDDPSAARAGRLPHLGSIAGHAPDPNRRLVMAVASPAGKRAVLAAMGLSPEVARPLFATLAHPRAWVSASARLGAGCIVGPFADISADAVLDDFVTLNAYASAGHDVAVGAFTTLSGYVDLTGGVQVGEGAFFGSGARVLPGLNIGRGCTVGAGAVVVRPAPDGATLYAAPARRL